MAALLVVLAGARRRAPRSEGIREVTATDRSLIPLQTRLRYTTMVVLPEGEEILDVICGDRDFWVISAVAERGAREAGQARCGDEPESRHRARHDLLVPADREERHAVAGPEGVRQRRRRGTDGREEVLQRRRRRAAAAGTDGRAREGRGRGAARDRDDRQASGTRTRSRLHFAYGTPRYEKPFLVRAMWHDGQFTYLQSDATELPALYELKDGEPAVAQLPGARAGHLRGAEGARTRLLRARRSERFSFSQRER